VTTTSARISSVHTETCDPGGDESNGGNKQSGGTE